MADVIVKLRVMPTDPGVDLQKMQTACEAKINEFGASVIHSVNQEPIAFGLKALVIIFLINEQKSDMEKLETNIKTISNVNSAEVIDVRRAIG